jgi:hypothetical protein
VLDHDQLDPVLGRVAGRLLAGVPLVDEGDFDLDPVTSWTFSANSPASARSCSSAAVTWTARRWTRVSTAMWTFDPFFRLCPSYPVRSPLSGVDRNVRASRITAVGWWCRPANTRPLARRSCATGSNAPLSSHRRACWYTAAHGGKSCGRNRQEQPVLTTYRTASNSSRMG